MPEHGEPQPGDPTISLDETRATATANAQRVAEIGSWPDHIEPEELLERIPKKGETAPGFDASVACSLNLIPEDKQRLSAVLHADYTKETVEQIRKELEDQSPDSETNWWLSASSLCLDEEVDTSGFLDQVEKFRELAANPDKRLQAAREEHEKMRASYHIEDGIPYGERDGCIQAAYIDGYPFGVYHSQKYGLYFVGTYEDSLGLEDFQWSDEKDEKGRPKSGPVHGSKQFVKCASEEELNQVLKVVGSKFEQEKTNQELKTHEGEGKEPLSERRYEIVYAVPGFWVEQHPVDELVFPKAEKDDIGHRIFKGCCPNCQTENSMDYDRGEKSVECVGCGEQITEIRVVYTKNILDKHSPVVYNRRFWICGDAPRMIVYEDTVGVNKNDRGLVAVRVGYPFGPNGELGVWGYSSHNAQSKIMKEAEGVPVLWFGDPPPAVKQLKDYHALAYDTDFYRPFLPNLAKNEYGVDNPEEKDKTSTEWYNLKIGLGNVLGYLEDDPEEAVRLVNESSFPMETIVFDPEIASTVNQYVGGSISKGNFEAVDILIKGGLIEGWDSDMTKDLLLECLERYLDYPVDLSDYKFQFNPVICDQIIEKLPDYKLTAKVQFAIIDGMAMCVKYASLEDALLYKTYAESLGAVEIGSDPDVTSNAHKRIAQLAAEGDEEDAQGFRREFLPQMTDDHLRRLKRRGISLAKEKGEGKWQPHKSQFMEKVEKIEGLARDILDLTSMHGSMRWKQIPERLAVAQERIREFKEKELAGDDPENLEEWRQAADLPRLSYQPMPIIRAIEILKKDKIDPNIIKEMVGLFDLSTGAEWGKIDEWIRRGERPDHPILAVGDMRFALSQSWLKKAERLRARSLYGEKKILEADETLDAAEEGIIKLISRQDENLETAIGQARSFLKTHERYSRAFAEFIKGKILGEFICGDAVAGSRIVEGFFQGESSKDLLSDERITGSARKLYIWMLKTRPVEQLRLLVSSLLSQDAEFMLANETKKAVREGIVFRLENGHLDDADIIYSEFLHQTGDTLQEAEFSDAAVNGLSSSLGSGDINVAVKLQTRLNSVGRVGTEQLPAVIENIKIGLLKILDAIPRDFEDWLSADEEDYYGDFADFFGSRGGMNLRLVAKHFCTPNPSIMSDDEVKKEFSEMIEGVERIAMEYDSLEDVDRSRMAIAELRSILQ